MRLGILGGTFNPIHFAHLRMAEVAREQCALERVLFIPAADPPHKPLAGNVAFSHRLAMVEAAIAGVPAFAATDLEARRPGKSYSVLTLEALRREQPETEFFFIIGLDSFRDLASWWNYRRLFELAHLVVAPRPGIAAEADPAGFLPVAVRSEFCYDGAKKALWHTSGHAVLLLEETFPDISSTRLRRLLADGRSVRYLLPPAVEQYITHHGLYRGPERL